MNNANLWAKYKDAPNADVKKQIMVNYTNLVHYVIHHSKFVNLNIIDERDYFQFGIEGLSEAIDRFDPEYGTKFETYAIQRIRGKIIDELRKLQIKPRIVYSENEVVYRNVSLDNPVDNEEGYSLNEVIPSGESTPEQILTEREQKKILTDAIKNMIERDRLIITLYYYENLNYNEIAEILNITISRVSQIHSKIIKDLKVKLKSKYE